MKDAVATHEAGHVCAILKMPIWHCIVEARIFEKEGVWYGDCKLDGECFAKVPSNDVFNFAKNIAGPLAELQLFENEVPLPLSAAIKSHGGLLAGYWWLYENSPQTEVHWHSDMRTWLEHRKFQKYDLSGFYETEKQVSDWLGKSATRLGISQIANELMRKRNLYRNDLLEINLEHVPRIKLPTSLLPSLSFQ